MKEQEEEVPSEDDKLDDDFSVEDEEAKAAEGGRRGGGGGFNDEFDPGEGAKDWKESVAKIEEDMPSFKNTPLIIRK